MNLKRTQKNQEFASQIKGILEKVIVLKNYSRSQIDIHICVVENDGSAKSASINAVTLALIDAGIAI